MYTGELNGMTLTLPDEDYKILEKRLMVSKAVKDGDGDYIIRRPCICDRYEHNCDDCPFSQVEGDCAALFDHFNPDFQVHFGESLIWWIAENDKQARTVIKSMRKALLGMKKV